MIHHPLDDALSGEPHLDDDGFTDRVLARLPARRRDPRPLVLGAACAAAAALAAAFLPGLVEAALPALLRGPLALQPLAALAAGASALAAGVAALTASLAR